MGSPMRKHLNLIYKVLTREDFYKVIPFCDRHNIHYDAWESTYDIGLSSTDWTIVEHYLNGMVT